jgi:hypothetical protein
MKRDNRSKAVDAEAVEKWLALISTALGQVPWVTTVTGVYSLSLYQPSIYQGKELFLLVPLMVGLFATWTVLRWPNAMWVVLAIFFALTGFVYWVYDTYGALSPIHPINWILSYCAFALFVAALTRVAIDAVKSIQQM